MFFPKVNRELKCLFITICVFAYSFAYACESQNGSSMVKDDLGNIYAVWSSDNEIPHASIKPATSTTWNPSATLFTSEGMGTSIATTNDGKVIAAWIGVTANPSQYVIYVSMLISGNWTSAFAISDPTETLLNGSFCMKILNNPVSGDTEMNFLWMSYYNSQTVMRTNTGIFGSNSNWTGPTNLP
jgi:hypothetical protein